MGIVSAVDLYNAALALDEDFERQSPCGDACYGPATQKCCPEGAVVAVDSCCPHEFQCSDCSCIPQDLCCPDGESCGDACHDLTTQKCCPEVVAVVAVGSCCPGEGQCGDFCYDSATQQCCSGGEVQSKSYCCPGKFGCENWDAYSCQDCAAAAVDLILTFAV